jgi:class 3 adenylate cyclase
MGFPRFSGVAIGGHCDVSLAREDKGTWRLRTPFYCAAARPRFRTAKIMVCTMVACTPHSADVDQMSERIAVFYKVLTDVAARFGGFVAQYLGDGVHVYFGYPAAHEHDAEQAVRAGLAILDAIGALKASSVEALRVRASLATGLVVVGELADAARD